MVSPFLDEALVNLFIQLFLMALTVVQEAGGKGYNGMLGVAWVLHRRQIAFKKSLTDVQFQAYQFSAWLTGSATLMNIDQISDALFFTALKACIAAVYELESDPTNSADHYLNEQATRAGRPNHDLPNWFEEEKVTARIGAHTFLKLL